MGTITDQPAVPYMPPPPAAGVAPSGIAQHPSIRGMANQAKANVSNKQREFNTLMHSSDQQPPQPVVSPVQKYASAAAALEVNHDIVDRFVDWVLFG